MTASKATPPISRLRRASSTGIVASLVLTVVAALPASAQQANSIRVTEFGKTGNWQVRAVFNHNKFDHCSSTAKYRDGTSVSIVARANGTWTLSFRHPSWPIRTGQTFPANVLVDGRQVLSGGGRFNGRSAIISLGNSVDRVVAVMRGQRMSIVTPSGSSAFSLLGTRGAATEAARCWTANRGAGGGAFGGGRASGGAFGGDIGAGNSGAFAAPATPTKAVRLSRAATLELATRYLGKSRQPYEILPEERNILKSYPVNWRYNNGVVGGMMGFRGATATSDSVIGKLLANRANACRGRHATQRLATENKGNMVVSKAISACDVNSTTVKQVLSVARFQSGSLLIIVEASASSAGNRPAPGTATSPPAPSLGTPRPPAANEL